MLLEYCAENYTNVPLAIENGADRIELCDNLAVGGTTASYGVLTQTLKYCKPKGVDVMSIIRCRAGDFYYNKEEVEMMALDIGMAVSAGTDGIVVGALTKRQGSVWLDEEAMLRFIRLCKQKSITFHMAFDEIPPENQCSAIDWLAENGVSRILTHGAPYSGNLTNIEENIPHLSKLVAYAKTRNVIILPGGGITHDNANSIAKELTVNELHGTRIINLNLQ